MEKIIKEKKDLLIKTIKEKQKEKGLTRYRIAKMVGMKQSTLSLIYNNKTKSFTIDTLIRICIALDVEIEFKKL